MIDFARFLPQEEDVAAGMPPEDLAVLLLAALRTATEPFQANETVKLPPQMYPKRRGEILLSLSEAFAYLQRECLVVLYPPELHNYADKDRPRYKVSRVAERLDLSGGLEAYRQSRLLPKELLHQRLLATVLPAFLRADYEIAVFATMKEVEVAVRKGAGLPESSVGVPLVRKAFAPDQVLGKGFIVDAERQALSDLFAGAIGYFRNSTGHRSVDIQPHEAARIILFGSHLLQTVDARLGEIQGRSAEPTL